MTSSAWRSGWINSDQKCQENTVLFNLQTMQSAACRARLIGRHGVGGQEVLRSKSITIDDAKIGKWYACPTMVAKAVVQQQPLSEFGIEGTTGLPSDIARLHHVASIDVWPAELNASAKLALHQPATRRPLPTTNIVARHACCR
eukprot:6179995-Pleurochrysis_carterae.AAC.1